MSNIITRKGIAVGSVVAIAFAGLVGAVPAYAAEDVTLTPASGSTYNSIREAGVVLETLLNSDEVSTEDALYYTIESTNGANIYDQLNFYFDNNQTHHLNSGDAYDEWNLSDGGSSVDDGYSYYYNTSSDLEDGDKITIYAVDGDSWYEDWYGAETDLYHDLNLGDAGQTLSIWAADSATNQNLEFTVTAWVDQDNDGVKDAFEPASVARNVKLFDSRNVTATTTIDPSTVLGGDLVATTTFNNDINPYFVASEDLAQYGQTMITMYRNGSELDDYYTYVSEAGVLTAYREDSVDVANYSARTYYEADSAVDYLDYVTGVEDSTSFVRWLSPLSNGFSLVTGTSDAVDGIYGNVADSTTVLLSNSDNGLDEESVYVKSGQKSVDVTSQITDLGVDLEVSNVRVKAVLDPINLDNSSDVTLTGTSDKITDEDDANITGFGRTNADGQFVFTVGNTQGLDADEVDVTLYVLLADGSWAEGDSFRIIWDDAVLNSFSGDLPATSGTNVTINYSALDQFGGGINIYQTKSLEVTVVAYDDTEDYNEVYDTDVLEKTVTVSSDGKASVSFTNFVSVNDGHGKVEAFLHKSDVEWDNTYIYSYVTDLYRNAATAEVDSVENEYSTEVTYGKFYEGNTSEDSDLVTDLNTDGVWGVTNSDYAWIDGRIVTSNGAGAAAQAVTISGNAGMLFETEYAEYTHSYDGATKAGSITVFTDVNGYFGVYVYSHTVKETGTPITITSGGKSFTTTLKTYHNDQIVSSTAYNKATMKFPERPGLGTSIATVSFADVLGNPFKVFTAQANSDESYTEDGNTALIDGVPAYEHDNDHEKSASAASVSFRVSSSDRGGKYGRIGGTFEFDLYNFVYDVNGDGDTNDSYEFTFEGGNVTEPAWNGVFGPQATAKSGAKAGVAKVAVFNAQGKTVRVYVGGSLKETFKNQKRVNKVKLKGLKAGDRTISVVIGKTRALTKSVTVK